MGRIGSALFLTVVLLGGTPAGPAGAAFPAANGKIAFSSDRDGDQEIFLMNADGSGPVNLTNNDVLGDREPAWSADGARVAFSQTPDGLTSEVLVMNADGSGTTNLTQDPTHDSEPAWSPDGTKIAFRTYRGGNYEVYVMNADGSNPINLTQNGAFDTAPAWSPDGSKIAFQTNRDALDNEIYVMSPDGSGLSNLTQSPGVDDLPAWSPDGTKIAFQSSRDLNDEVYLMNADGSGQVNLTNNPASDGVPEWSPDGTKIIFTSDRTGDPEVFVMNVDGSDVDNLTDSAGLDGDADWQPLQFAKEVSLKAKPKVVVKGEKTRLTARVSPCEGHEGDEVEFYRKKKRIATKASNADCVAKLKVKVTKTTKFRAVSPEQDFDHLAGASKPVKVKVKA